MFFDHINITFDELKHPVKMLELNLSFSNLFPLLFRGLLDDIVFVLGAAERSRDPARLALLLRQRHVRLCFGSGRGRNRVSILSLVGAEIRGSL